MSHSPEVLKQFEQKLREQQSELRHATLSAVAQGRETVADDTQDSADQAVTAYQKEFLFNQGTNANAQLTLVRDALDRLADGTFGECQHCGKTIGFKRLEALPWTPYCIDCQEKIETGQMEDPLKAA